MKNKLAGLSQQEVYAYIETYVYKHYQQDICAARGGGVCYSGTLPGDRGYGLPDGRIGYGLPREAIVNEFRQAESSFAAFLFELIDAAKLKDADVYKRADVSKSVFSKIRQGQHPDKKTAIALAVALRLPLTKTQDLLQKAGYCLSRSIREDLIVQGFIAAREYDIDKIRAVIADKDFCPGELWEWRLRYRRGKIRERMERDSQR